jgi:RNA polymerase sigma factor (sigma-70 family)
VRERELEAATGHKQVVPERTDSELWRLAAAGDHASFGALYERHARAVYNFCFRRTASWSHAEDLVSEVFLVAWRRRAEVRLATETGESLPWLLGVAVNVLRNHLRSGRRGDAALRRLNPSESEPDFSDDVVGRVADERQMSRVLAVVNRLSPQEQDVLALCGWAGLSYEDGAVALGVPVGTVRSRLSRAREHLRELVGGDGHDSSDERVVGAQDERG